MIRRPPRSTLSSSSAASDVYKRQPPPPRPATAAGHRAAPPAPGRSPGRHRWRTPGRSRRVADRWVILVRTRAWVPSRDLSGDREEPTPAVIYTGVETRRVVRDQIRSTAKGTPPTAGPGRAAADRRARPPHPGLLGRWLDHRRPGLRPGPHPRRRPALVHQPDPAPGRLAARPAGRLAGCRRLPPAGPLRPARSCRRPLVVRHWRGRVTGSHL